MLERRIGEREFFETHARLRREVSEASTLGNPLQVWAAREGIDANVLVSWAEERTDRGLASAAGDLTVAGPILWLAGFQAGWALRRDYPEKGEEEA